MNEAVEEGAKGFGLSVVGFQDRAFDVGFLRDVPKDIAEVELEPEGERVEGGVGHGFCLMVAMSKSAALMAACFTVSGAEGLIASEKK